MISSSELFLEDEVEKCLPQYMRNLRASLRDKSNPLELPDTKFIAAFRINKEGFLYLLSEMEDKFRSTVRTSSIPPILKLCAALRFFGSGSYQQNIGDDFNIGMAQPTVSLAITEVVDIFEKYICGKWIKFEMSESEKLDAKIYFMSKYKFPGVIGCVDGTHIKIISPEQEDRHLYFNRKGYYSLNVMIICDHNMIIRYLDSRHPGANHDSFIWNTSVVNSNFIKKFENGERNSWLLGDSGYPLLPYLMTPYRAVNPETPQFIYNEAHSLARKIIERTIGVLKSRFRCLLGARELHYTADKAKKIVNSCSALHNICRFYKMEDVPIVDSVLENTDELDDEADAYVTNLELQREAKKIRSAILNSL